MKNLGHCIVLVSYALMCCFHFITLKSSRKLFEKMMSYVLHFLHNNKIVVSYLSTCGKHMSPILC